MTARVQITGSITTPIKRALIEMFKSGALRQQNSGPWKSCNGASFYSSTIIAMAKRNLAIISVNKRFPGIYFARLTVIGKTVGGAVFDEANLRRECEAAAERTLATQLSPVITIDEQQNNKVAVVP